MLSGNSYASKIGKGEIQLSRLKNFIKFFEIIVVTPDGTYSTFGILVSNAVKEFGKYGKWCKKDSGKKCYVFAQRKKQQKIIRWNKVDYVFPKGKWSYNAMVKSASLKSHNKGLGENINDDQIKSILHELGFIKFNKQVNTINLNNEETITKSKEKKTISKQQQVEIEQIKEMFDIGALTKDEYDAEQLKEC